MLNKISYLVVLLLIAALFATDIPHAINYQGKLFESGGAVSGQYDFIIVLYDAETGGTARWTKTFDSAPGVTVNSGLFTLTLSDDDGSTNIADILVQYQNLWIEVRVQTHGGSGYSTLAPREKLLAAPWALTVADDAITDNKIDWGTGSGQVSADDVTFSADDAGWGGSPPAEVDAGLEDLVNRVSSLESGSGNYVLLSPAVVQGDADTDPSIWINKTAASGNLLQLQQGGTNQFVIDYTGNATLMGNLEVDGNNISGNSTGSPAFYVHSDGNIRMDIDDDNDGTSTFGIRNGGNTVVFEVFESGNVVAQGNGTFDGNLTLSGASGRAIDFPDDAGNIFSSTGLDIVLDSDNSGTSSEFSIKKNGDAGNKLFSIWENASPLVYPYGTSSGNTGGIRFRELAANGTNYTGFQAPDALGSDYMYTLPTTDGTDGQVLTSDGSGGLSWTTITPGANSLQEAYEGGNTIEATVADGSVDISNSATETVTPLVVMSDVGGNEAAYFGNSASGNAIKTGGGSNSGNIWMATGNLAIDAGNIYLGNNQTIFAKNTSATDMAIFTPLNGSNNVILSMADGNNFYIQDNTYSNVAQFSGGSEALFLYGNLHLKDNKIIYDGTVDANQTYIGFIEPTNDDNVINFPDASGTVALTNNTDNYQYWTASDGTNNTNITSTSALTYSGSGGIATSLFGNTLTIDGSGISSSQWTDAGDYLRPSDDANELTKVYETAAPTYRVRAFSRVTTGDYASGALGYYGNAIGGINRHIGVYGNSGTGASNVAVAGRYLANTYGYLGGSDGGGTYYGVFGVGTDNGTGNDYGGMFTGRDAGVRGIGSGTATETDQYGGMFSSSGGTSNSYGVYGEATGSATNYGVYGTASGGTSNYGAYGEYDANHYGYLGNSNWGVYGASNSTSGAGVGGFGTGTDGVYGESDNANYSGGYFLNSNTSGTAVLGLGNNLSSSTIP
ncbi:hypothetical protein J7L68_09755, partial [bacterium]|nr:hypothetical protein [bacterium]